MLIGLRWIRFGLTGAVVVLLMVEILHDLKGCKTMGVPINGYYVKDPKLWELSVYSLVWVMPGLYHQP